MTLLVRDEADLLGAQLAFHLAAGVDFVVATDHASRDGSTEILRSYERDGVLRLIEEPDGVVRQGDWVTRMARLAVTQHGADWVVNSDADEFWWPRGGTLKDVLGAVPPRFGIVRAFWRHFLPRPGGEERFAERMTVRLTPRAPVDPLGPFHPHTKVVHRADPEVRIGRGNHDAFAPGLIPISGWFPIEVLHFPIRTYEQCERKYGERFAAWVGGGGHGTPPHMTTLHELHRTGGLRGYYDSITVDDEALPSGVAEGRLAIDTRVREALRSLAAGRQPDFLTSPALDVEYATDVAALADALPAVDPLRQAQARVDALEVRLASLERGLGTRLRSAAGRFAARAHGSVPGPR
jgi:hypothetical protein